MSMIDDQIPSAKSQITNNDQITKIRMTETEKPRQYDLEARTLVFAKRVICFSKMLPKNNINYELISQLVRASCSVGANYREANEALSKKDFVHRIKICRKEAKETSYWINLICDTNPEFNKDIAEIDQETTELRKIFSSILAKST